MLHGAALLFPHWTRYTPKEIHLFFMKANEDILILHRITNFLKLTARAEQRCDSSQTLLRFPSKSQHTCPASLEMRAVARNGELTSHNTESRLHTTTRHQKIRENCRFLPAQQAAPSKDSSLVFSEWDIHRVTFTATETLRKKCWCFLSPAKNTDFSPKPGSCWLKTRRQHGQITQQEKHHVQ